MRNILSVSGGYWTGSSAVVALLEEFDEIEVVPGEFTSLTNGQLLENISTFEPGHKEKVNELKLNTSRFYNFHKKEVRYVFSALRLILSKLKIYNRWVFTPRVAHVYKYNRGYKTGYYSMLDLLKTSNLTAKLTKLNPGLNRAFDSHLNDYLQGLAGNENSKTLAFDQLIAPNYFELANNSIENFQLLFLDRDWKDQYVEIRSHVDGMAWKKMKSKIHVLGKPINNNELDPIRFFLGLRRSIDNFKSDIKEKENVLVLDFEDLVYSYDESLAKIEDFTGLKMNPTKRKSIFNPEVSKKNIGKWLKSDYQSELRIIANELGYEYNL